MDTKFFIIERHGPTEYRVNVTWKEMPDVAFRDFGTAWVYCLTAGQPEKIDVLYRNAAAPYATANTDQTSLLLGPSNEYHRFNTGKIPETRK